MPNVQGCVNNDSTMLILDVIIQILHSNLKFIKYQCFGKLPSRGFILKHHQGGNGMVPTGSFVPKTVKILLAEDNPVNQEVICEMLISIGCQVQVVSNGQQAIDALNHESYDMIFMDCQMPVMDGHEAARRIRSLEQQKGQKNIPIVGITGRAVRDNYEKSEKASMDDLLDKPFTIEQLKATIFRWTGFHLEDSMEAHGKTKISNQYSSLPSPTGSYTDCIDIKALKNISKLEYGSNKFLKKIVTIYLKNSPHLIYEINEGVQDKNTEKIFHAAHSLKSTSASLGATTLSSLCQELELSAQHQMIDDAASQLARIKSEYARVVDALNSFINNLE
jgi:two-component system, sensor histidine kinase and response regulator